MGRPKNSTIRVAAVQMASIAGDKEKNIKKAMGLLNEAPWDLAVLPELFGTEFFPVKKDPAFFDYAEPIHGPTVKRMARVARRKRGYLIVPFFERDEADVCYNSAAIIDRKGEVLGVYRKIHIPFTRTYEKYYFSPGRDLPIFQTDFGNLGILICYDRWYPEAWRRLILAGAVLVAIPISSWKYQNFSEIPIWEPLLRIRARENLVYVLAANRVGREGDFSYFGRSAVVNPRGEIVAELTEEEESLLVAEVDLTLVRQERANLPLLRDRRPDIY